MIKCEHCGADTTNPKFCSRSCCAKYNNSKMPKRTRTVHFCESCKSELPPNHWRRKYCDDCHKIRSDAIRNRQLGNDRASSKILVNRYARQLARKSAMAISPVVSCAFCGYSKHVEACHIKPISQFSSESTMSEINDPSNIVLLCPNCHWEFDHGLLDDRA